MNSLLKTGVLHEALRKLDEFDRWLILIHINPDGDTLGCGLATYSFGARRGKEARVIGGCKIPESYCFMPFADKYEQIKVLTPGDVTDDTLIICVDTSTTERSVCGLKDFINENNSINIDHHGDNQLIAGLNIIVPEASATAEIITEIMLKSGYGIDTQEAVCLYAALVTDNGYFKFKSTKPQSHLCAARLLEAGVKPSQLDDFINQNMTREIMWLWGTVFSRAEVFANGNAAVFWVSKNDFIKAKAEHSAIDGLVNQLLRIMGVKIALLLSDYEGSSKLSVRTRMPYSAREIAAVWGGGGHVQAAGAMLSLPLEKALNSVRDTIEKYVADRNPASE